MSPHLLAHAGHVSGGITDFALTIWLLTVAWVGFGLRHNDDLLPRSARR